MGNIHLSKSSYCSCVQCEKILWLDKFKKEASQEERNESVFENGKIVGNLAKGLFGDYVEVPFDTDIEKRLSMTQNLLGDAPNVIAEASFSFDNNFCSVDVLKNDTDGVEIYEVKSSTKIKDIYVDDVAYQYCVLSNLGLNVKRACIVYVNNKYVLEGELEMDKLFNIEDLTSVVLEKQDEIKSNIESINEFMNSNGDSEPDVQIEEHCFNPYLCRFWQYCSRDLPTPNVFDLKGIQRPTKFKKFREGKISFEDLQGEDINQKALEQIDFELNCRKPKINKDAINDVLNSLKYPLYFIDYETCQYAIPVYEGTKPYQQIPFQYSLHIIPHEGADIEHREYLAEFDDENIIRNFAESMIGDMPEDGSVIVYNRSFEASRNRDIGEMYPDLKGEMDRINDNMVDLMVPFKQRNYYTREMQGSYSIKYVLPALYPDDESLDYSNLSLIHKGDEASNAFLSLKDKTPVEREKIRNALLKYCELDTYAMVKIWEKFIEVTE